VAVLIRDFPTICPKLDSIGTSNICIVVDNLVCCCLIAEVGVDGCVVGVFDEGDDIIKSPPPPLAKENLALVDDNDEVVDWIGVDIDADVDDDVVGAVVVTLVDMVGVMGVTKLLSSLPSSPSINESANDEGKMLHDPLLNLDNFILLLEYGDNCLGLEKDLSKFPSTTTSTFPIATLETFMLLPLFVAMLSFLDVGLIMVEMIKT
jgi:hypothetical protein